MGVMDAVWRRAAEVFGLAEASKGLFGAVPPAETEYGSGDGMGFGSGGTGMTVKSCGPGAVVFTPATLEQRFGPGTAFPRSFSGGTETADALRSSVVLPCVTALTLAMQEIRLCVQDARTGRPVAHALDEVFAAPTNQLARAFGDPARYTEMSTAEMLVRMMTFAAVGGVAYVEKIVAGRRLVGLQVHHRFSVERDWRTGRAAAVRRPDGRWERVEARDVIALKWPVAHPEDDGIGLAPAEALLKELGMDRYATAFAHQLLTDDGIPFQALKLPMGATMGTEERAMVKQEYLQRAGRRGELAILENGAEFTRPGLTLNEMNLEQIYRVPESRAPACFRVPAPIAGLALGVENSTYSNYAEAREAFAEGTVAPIAANWGSALDAGMRAERWIRTGQRLVLDCSGLAAMQELKRRGDEAARSDYLAGVIDLEEARGAMGRRGKSEERRTKPVEE